MLSGAWYRGDLPFYKIITAIFERSKQFLKSYLTKIDEEVILAKYREFCEEDSLPVPELDLTIGSLQLFTIVDIIRF